MSKLLLKQTGVFINKKIKIFDEFKDGLLNIDKFGHIIVFYISDKVNQYSLSNINISVAEIINIFQNEIDVFSLDIPENSIIIDIKPYFPVEDRVENCFTEEKYSNFPEFFGKYNDDTPKTYSQLKIIPDISFCGTIKKEKGICYLQFDNIYDDYLTYYEKFSHLYVIWWFDKFEKDFYKKTLQCNPPYENAPKTGIFASRSPVRINPVALTLAKIINVDKINKRIQISLTDAFDNSPFIDVKPYIPYYFKVNNFSVPKWLNHWSEWFEEIILPVIDNNIILNNSDFDKIKNYFSVSNNLNNEKIIFENNDEKSEDFITIVNACENNLKNVCVKIPKNKITTITGLSGSGKSTLAFDVIYAESQRRFIDTFSNSEKQIFKQFEKPNVEKINNLPPATAIEQSKLHKNSLSTIATYSDLSDYIKTLFAKIGIRHCPKCKKAVEPKKRYEIKNIILNIPDNCLYKIVSLKNNNILKDFNDSKENIKNEIENILEKEDGAIKIGLINNEEYILHERNKCYYCNLSFFELTKSNFTYNNPESICLNCNGSGVQKDVLPQLIISNPEKSILDNASQWWGNLRTFIDNPSGNWMKGEVIGLAKNMNVDIEKPWNELPKKFKEKALYGTNDEIVSLKFKSSNGREGEINRVVEGAVNHIKRLYKNSFGKNTNEFYSQFMSEQKCNVCTGEKLSFESRIVTVFNKRFPEIMNMTVIELYNWAENLSQNISKSDFEISKEIIYNILKKCKTLIDVGVEYLQLSRSVSTISGGEAQRLKLASRLNCGLTNLLYILDEPTIGLHKTDKLKIINILKKLKDAGNTIIVVEHNKDMILNSDYIIDMGLKGGINGGEIVACGDVFEIINNKNSITGKYLIQSSNLNDNIPVETRQLFVETRQCLVSTEDNKQLKIFGATKNNLKNISVSFPLGKFICVTGKSGSGKSSLIAQTLVPVLTYYCNHKVLLKNDYEKIEGLEYIDKIISVTQEAIGKTPRSNPATYTGVFDEIRELFAQTKEAKLKKYSSNKFSFNTKEGYCKNCKGEGKIKIEMNFTADIWVKCLECEGKRYNEEALSIKYKEKTISDVLDTDVDEAIDFFKENKKIYKILKTMQNTGLGYIKLGQSALTLSGGEAQRIKLAKELSKNQSNKTIYILDEPTTGLHFEDTKHLINLLKEIISNGNTVIVIEYNEEIINCADFIIELGPEGGENGGYLI